MGGEGRKSIQSCWVRKWKIKLFCHIRILKNIWKKFVKKQKKKMVKITYIL